MARSIAVFDVRGQMIDFLSFHTILYLVPFLHRSIARNHESKSIGEILMQTKRPRPYPDQLKYDLDELDEIMAELRQLEWAEKPDSVLIISPDRVLQEQLLRGLSLTPPDRVIVELDYSTSVWVPTFNPPAAVVVDCAIGMSNAMKLFQMLDESYYYRATVLLSKDEQVDRYRSDIKETFRRPFDVSLLIEHLRALVHAQKTKKKKIVDAYE